MKKTIVLLAAFVGLITALPVRAQVDFNTYFEKKSLRFDFILAGSESSQFAYLDALSQEPIWSGPVKNLIDTDNLGGYQIRLYDEASGKLIYSAGMSTLFDEWRTTDEAKSLCRSYPNTMVMPFPKNKAKLELLSRNKATLAFEPLFEMKVDPKSIIIDQSKRSEYEVRAIQEKGSSNEKVDLVLLAEGYTQAEMEKFYADAKRIIDTLFSFAPFDKHRNDFNVWAVGVPSEDSNTDLPGANVWRNTAFNSGFWTFGIDRYLTTGDYKSIRNAVWNVPCDAIMILVNSDAYGGGGIYNYYAMGTVGHRLSARVMVHEFGHSFGGLGDEYFTSAVAYGDTFYNLDQEPWEPNLTTLVNFKTKWADMVDKNTPIPTPATKQYANKVGAFEGGGYLTKGMYRPADFCMMRNNSNFCPVCQRAIVRRINFLIDK